MTIATTTNMAQDIAATEYKFPDASTTDPRMGSAMVSERDKLWAVISEKYPSHTDNKGAYIYMYTVDSSGIAKPTCTITLPVITDKNSSWRVALHRKISTPVIKYLRIHGDYIWATDYASGAIYRFKKNLTVDTTAQIIFFAPVLLGNDPVQFYDLAFQEGAAGTPGKDTLWVGDGYIGGKNLYSILVPVGFGNEYTGTLPLTNMTTHDISVTSTSADCEVSEIVCYNDRLWVMVKDQDDDALNGLYTADISTGTPSQPHFISTPHASGFTEDKRKHLIYIGNASGGLLKKDISLTDAKEIVKVLDVVRPDAATATSRDPQFDHYRMNVDDAGYIWSTPGPADDPSDMVNCYSPLGTLARQYKVILSGSPTALNAWTSPVIIDGTHVAVLDSAFDKMAIFAVDTGFILGDFNLKFDPSSDNSPINTPVATLPLQAWDKALKAQYTQSTSATLTDKNDGSNKLFDLATAGDYTVDILTGQPSVKLDKPVTTGSVVGKATIIAEARTTGIKSVEYALTLTNITVNITANPDKDHVRVDGSIDIRQDKENDLPNVVVHTAANTDGNVELDDTTKTGTKFSQKPNTGDTDTLQKVANIDSNHIPAIIGGKKVGDVNVKVTVGTANAAKTMHVIALADKLEHETIQTPGSISAIIDLINSGLTIITKGSTDSSNQSHDTFAPKTVISLKVVTPGNKVYFVQNKIPINYLNTIYAITDDDGKLLFKDDFIQLAGILIASDIKKHASYIEVCYDTSGLMNVTGAETRKYSNPDKILLQVSSF